MRRLWIEKASDIKHEYYASFTLDRSAKQYLGMLSARGGVDIEQVAKEAPEAIARLYVNPVDGLTRAAAEGGYAVLNWLPKHSKGQLKPSSSFTKCSKRATATSRRSIRSS
ncbi:MAG: ATP-grasp domain-containing protein [Anaerolineae bacterium]